MCALMNIQIDGQDEDLTPPPRLPCPSLKFTSATVGNGLAVGAHDLHVQRNPEPRLVWVQPQPPTCRLEPQHEH